MASFDAFLDPAVASMLIRLALSVLILGVLTVSVYRLYLSPLANFPGPKLAAWTQWYEFYWNVIRPGQFTFHLQELHDTYGPIIRINPWELHIRDPDFFETIFDGGKRDKVLAHVKWIDNGLAAQATVDHEHHRLRRAAQNPFFSKRQIQQFSPYIQSCADKLCGRLAAEFTVPGKPVCISDAYGCLSGDVVLEYCFAKNDDFLGLPDFDSPFLRATATLETGIHVVTHFPWLMAFALSLPDFVLPSMVMQVWNFKRSMRKQIQDIMDDRNQGYKDASHPTVFKELLDSDLPASEKTIRRLEDEGITVVGAGQETVKVVLTVTTFHLLQNPKMMERLRKEIITVFPDPSNPPDLTKLEQLPYLSAVLQEGLRLSYGLSGRVARVSQTPVIYGPFTIPPGVIFSTDSYGAHHDETLFPDSHSFVPERWLDNPRAPALKTYGSSQIEKGGRLLSRYNVAFSKGTRQCLGMHLATAELFITLANVVRRCKFEMYETEWKDIGFVRDMFVPHPDPSSKGLRVLVQECL